MKSIIKYETIQLLRDKKTLIFILLFLIGSYYLNTHIDSPKKILISIIYITVLVYFFARYYIKDGFTILKPKH